MNSYRFEDKKLIETTGEADDAILYCFSYAQLKATQEHPFNAEGMITLDKLTEKSIQRYFKEDIHLIFWANKILNSERDTYIGRYSNYTILSITLIDHEDERRNEPLVMIIYDKYSLLFYDDQISTPAHHIKNINEIFSQLMDITCPNLLIPYALIRHDLSTDRAFLRDVENQALELELSLVNNPQDPQNTILKLRKTISNYKHYYLSLIDLFEDITEDYATLLSKETLQNYRRLRNKIDRLYKYGVMLGEYVSQVNDRYRAQIDLNLNKTMRTFTVLSAIFLPLTLIVGWYGMNFEGMPELGLKYGYLYVIGLSLSILIGSLLYIKKRGFWD